jgi:biofilm PGA synthesis N-glycosyltransferase PgaC
MPTVFDTIIMTAQQVHMLAVAPRDTVVLIPSGPEPELAHTLESVFHQTMAPLAVVVVINNCNADDPTIAVAQRYGCDTIVMRSNPHRKSGALNVGAKYIMRSYPEARYILQMDADTELAPDILHRFHDAMVYNDELTANPSDRRRKKHERIGALSCAFLAKKGIAKNWRQRILMWPQAAEYARYQDSTIRADIPVVSGTACYLRIEALKAVMESRGTDGVWNVLALTEDLELTLMMRKLGWVCRKSTKFCAYTDLMPTTGKLLGQRTRWQKGTILELMSFGVKRFTIMEWARQIFHFLMMLLHIGGTGICIYYLALGQTHINPVLGIGLAGLALVQAYHLRGMGWRSVLLGLLLLPEILYNFFRHVWWIKGTIQALLTKDRSKTIWT